MPAEYNPNLQRVLPDLLGPDLVNLERGLDCYVLNVYTGAIVRILTLLRDHPQCLFKQLVDITVIDYPSKAQRFKLVYHLLSHQFNERLRIKCHADEALLVPSSVGVFPCANWYEREMWDLFGIHFADHPDLRRILSDYNFSGHPLRKDFPLSGYVQVSFNEEIGRVANEPVNLSQEYRNFDFLSPWEGSLQPKQLPGDEKTQKNDEPNQ